MAPAVLLMGAAPLARWRHGSLPDMAPRLRWGAVASAAIGLGLLLVLRNASALSGLGLLLAAWCVLSAVTSLAARLRQQQGRRLAALRQFTPSYWGMLLAHAGVGVFIAGVTLVSGQESLRELPMRAGESVSVGGYDFRFAGVTQGGGPNYDALRGTLVAARDGKRVALLHPERRIYRSQDMPTTEAAIDSGVARDLYVALGENVDGSAWAVRIHVKPFVDWIWAGCVLMALGGLLAVCDKRYRLRRRAANPATAPAAPDVPAVPALASAHEETPA